jgi:sugar transferase (PEP-CTERM/EpsH1 system associated)
VRVLLLTHRLPYAPNRGDRVRAYHIARTLKPFADVDLVSFVHDDEEAGHACDVQDLVASATVVRVPQWRNRLRAAASLGTDSPLTHLLLDEGGITATLGRVVSRHLPDVVLAYCSGMARFAVEPLLSAFPLVLDMVDLDSSKWSALAQRTSGPMRWIYRREARLLRAFERKAVRQAFCTLVVNDRERDEVLRTTGEVRVEVLGNGVDVDHLRPLAAPSAEPGVIFCGVMDYAPNVQGALWLARDVWPLVRAQRSNAKLWLVGSDPSPAVRNLHDPSTIEVTGRVADVRPYLWGAAVAAAPLQIARGVQNKVLEAVAAGLPVVATSAVAAGLPLEILPACTTADSAREFAAALVRELDRSPQERRARAGKADLNVLSWEKRLARLPALLSEAAESSVSAGEARSGRTSSARATSAGQRSPGGRNRAEVQPDAP